MSNYEVGSIVEGKVTGIKPFGAFVAIDDQKQGLVHISEVAHGFVKDINDVLSVGDEVKVKILSVDEESGKISLSIRATQEAPERPARAPKPRPAGGGGRKPQKGQSQGQGFNTLEDKLKEWLKQSNEIQADLNKRAKK
ncbi:S1 domain-containing post-transcriptional regulator GSP13 [Halalkalibacterium halodurans]|jgi:general stress protein 13|uniref:Polyribonucleotide nucleotidyltransferase (General stress protein 13) n=2 Tax=Halalkalibacterium halodurans TaxID=86665 RepID=Q9K7L4_HALH5|nr:S1 domain-containing post-transcriptional regulator GSP13 [Halalkalibacterium halodurans]MDY7223879.1 S1 domain-containing post-transcriptional regulator GSP13 [Halalkalibacterium halodurans]MDY7243100.1 S1 domain-containing post-transcriptional regulator GSP13 [Halalkalibacterium halodurans]MED3648764.1 S1 domain-containing post-transcriptional regulator GSP13 [Halalkalibacterium halodurans]MED4080623.1 S1 domain-containing post-transcriptional regulator GSP13 [Halalkalibacterium halodurans